MAASVYNVGKRAVFDGKVTNGATNLKAALITGTKTGADNQDLTTMQAIEDVASVSLHSERVALSSVTLTTDQTDNRVEADSGDITFAVAGGVTALAVVIYDATTDTNDGTRIPILFDDTNFGAGKSLDGGLVVQVSEFLRGA